jgi:hypothetical protein
MAAAGRANQTCCQPIRTASRPRNRLMAAGQHILSLSEAPLQKPLQIARNVKIFSLLALTYAM